MAHPRRPAAREAPAASRGPSLEELHAEAVYAEERASLYRRKVLLGRGEPRRLAELERIAAGAHGRAESARQRKGGAS